MHDRSGRLLIPAGMVLQDKQIRVLLSWGISTVEIVEDEHAAANDSRDDEAPDLPADARPTPEMETQADAILAERFRHCDATGYPMDGIYSIARTQLLDELMRRGHKPRSA
ncbi:hypothetical protein [Thioalkalivibrio sp. ALMg11]|uniref:hypothetical protein n=1 Tax=Thioalkalivibrio sp. ALMg11 TaxID=1158165 RepID=UPI000374920E|nr:hypothetical protein [Thioalkalivibrio sp. ALMg11]